MAAEFSKTISRFLGLNQSTENGNTQKGESPRMKNLVVDRDYSLKKRKGFLLLYENGAEGRGIWSGTLLGEKRLVWVAGSRVCEEGPLGARDIGQLETNTGKVTIFHFNGRLYFLDGKKIKVYDGETFGEIKPYIPLIAISCSPNGGGVLFEGANLLSAQRRVSYTLEPDTEVVYLPEKDIESVDEVYYRGEVLDTDKYTVRLEFGRVEIPELDKVDTPNSLVITYTKSSGDFPELIHRMKYAISYGGDNDTRVFLWGDEEYPFHLRYSGVHDGESGFDYFPELNFNKIGSSSPISSVVRHYDRLMIFSEGESYYSYGEIREDSEGVEYTAYPVKTLSSEVGCSAPDFARLIDNFPVTYDNDSLYRWSSSAVRDERNAVDFGTRIKAGLKSMRGKEIVSFDRAATSEFFICDRENVYVYNYALDVFYYHTGIAPRAMCEYDGALSFIDREGRVFLEGESDCDGNVPVEFGWESGFGDFGELAVKNIHRVEFKVSPSNATKFAFRWSSGDRTGERRVIFPTSHLNPVPAWIGNRIKTNRARDFKLLLESVEGSGEFNLTGIRVRGRLTDLN